MTTTASTTPMLELTDVVVRYGRTQALHGVSMRVEAGEIVAMIGANGAGKSTTLRAVSGLLKVPSGTVALNGTSIANLAADRIVGLGIAHCPEERHIWPAMSVYENLQVGGFLVKSRAALEERIEKAFERFPRLRERRTQLAWPLSYSWFA